MNHFKFSILLIVLFSVASLSSPKKSDASGTPKRGPRPNSVICPTTPDTPIVQLESESRKRVRTNASPSEGRTRLAVPPPFDNEDYAGFGSLFRAPSDVDLNRVLQDRLEAAADIAQMRREEEELEAAELDMPRPDPEAFEAGLLAIEQERVAAAERDMAEGATREGHALPWGQTQELEEDEIPLFERFEELRARDVGAFTTVALGRALAAIFRLQQQGVPCRAEVHRDFGPRF